MAGAAGAEVRVDPLAGQVSHCQVALLQPAAQVRGQPQLGDRAQWRVPRVVQRGLEVRSEGRQRPCYSHVVHRGGWSAHRSLLLRDPSKQGWTAPVRIMPTPSGRSPPSRRTDRGGRHAEVGIIDIELGGQPAPQDRRVEQLLARAKGLVADPASGDEEPGVVVDEREQAGPHSRASAGARCS